MTIVEPGDNGVRMKNAILLQRGGRGSGGYGGGEAVGGRGDVGGAHSAEKGESFGRAAVLCEADDGGGEADGVRPGDFGERLEGAVGEAVAGVEADEGASGEGERGEVELEGEGVELEAEREVGGGER